MSMFDGQNTALTIPKALMPRANRHFGSGLVWHLTHRCHKREFLLKFGRDRDNYLR